MTLAEDFMNGITDKFGNDPELVSRLATLHRFVISCKKHTSPIDPNMIISIMDFKDLDYDK